MGEYLQWGNPNEKATFESLLSYSPCDPLSKNAYLSILVTTSSNDSQVMHWEPVKFVAKLRTLKDRACEFAWMLDQLGIRK